MPRLVSDPILRLGRAGVRVWTPATSVSLDPPAFVNASTAAAASTSCTPAPPAGIQAGDVMLAIIAGDVDSAGASFTIIGGTGGWAAVPGFPGTLRTRMRYRVATGSEPATYTASDPDMITTVIRCTIVAYRPAAGTTLAAAGDAQSTASGTNHSTPAIDPSAGNAMLVVLGVADAGHTWTAPAGMDERKDDSAQVTVGAFDVVQEGGESVSKTATLNSADTAVMAIVALVPEAA